MVKKFGLEDSKTFSKIITWKDIEHLHSGQDIIIRMYDLGLLD